LNSVVAELISGIFNALLNAATLVLLAWIGVRQAQVKARLDEKEAAEGE